jgi:hypothetical protein
MAKAKVDLHKVEAKYIGSSKRFSKFEIAGDDTVLGTKIYIAKGAAIPTHVTVSLKGLKKAKADAEDNE